MYKFLFELLVEPLGLPIDFIYEYLIMAVIDIAAYKLAFEKTGQLFSSGWIVRGEGKSTHWLLRLLYFIGMWALMRAAIWAYGFVIENKGVSIFAVGCITAIIATIRISAAIEERNRLQKVRVSYVDMEEEKDE